MEASDGSRQVKVWLHCPSCRSDLSHSIRDTLLLRKVDEMLHLMRETNDESVLSEAQSQLKDAFERSKEVQAAVEESRRREANYLGQELLEEDDITTVPSIEEWGVEADLVAGVHDSIRWPRSPGNSYDDRSHVTESQIDPILFCGLDFYLHDCDRLYLTELMISGNPDNLAEAAQVLSTIATTLRKTTPTLKQGPPLTNPKARNIIKRSSVFNLVAEVNESHRHESKYEIPPIPTRTGNVRRVSSQHVMHLAQRQKLFPLPVRMPKYVEINSSIRMQLSLIDNEWDGTVLDAYSKITIGFNHRVTQRRPDHKGIRNILGPGEVRVELPHQARVLLLNVPREMGQQGATKGDVLTHIQGQSVAAMTVEEVRNVLLLAVPEWNGKIQLVLNADRPVSEALKRRAAALSEFACT